MLVTYDELNNIFTVSSNNISTIGKRSKDDVVKRHLIALENKIKNLRNKISILESRKYEQQIEEHRKMSNIGWGSAMRGYKCMSIKLDKSEKTQTKINNIKQQIDEIQKELNEFEK